MSIKKFGLEHVKNVTGYMGHPILHKHLELLRTFMGDGVMCVFHSESDGFWMEECCDNYYCHTLTKEECLELSEMFKEIAISMEEKNGNFGELDLDVI